MSSNNYNLNNSDYAIAGAASGIFTRFTCQPLDVLKIRFQIQATPIDVRSGNSRYKSIIQAAIRIRNEEGITALWKGHMPAQWLSAAFGAAQFATYEMITKPWRQNSVAHFAGGAISGIIAVVISYPFDVIRTRLVAQGEPKIYHGIISTGEQVVRLEGWRGLFKGIVPACIQNAPLSALIFGINHMLTSAVRLASGSDRDLSTIESLCCGSLSGFCGKTMVYPLDLMKKRLQMQGMPDGSSASGPIMRTSGLYHCFVTTFRNEGIRGLYKGLAPSVLKATVSYAIYLASYDKACQYLVYLRAPS